MTQRDQSDTLFTLPEPVDRTNASGRPVLSFPCPRCGARRGELCTVKDGVDYAAKIHKERLRMARALL